METAKAKVKPRWTDGSGAVVSEIYSYQRSFTCIDVEKRLVEVYHVSRTKSGSDVYVRNVFDFSGLGMEEILEVAAHTSLIASRPVEFRTRTTAEALEMDGKVLFAKDYFKRERANREPATPIEMVTKLRKKFGLSKSEILAMLEAEDD